MISRMINGGQIPPESGIASPSSKNTFCGVDYYRILIIASGAPCS